MLTINTSFTVINCWNKPILLDLPDKLWTGYICINVEKRTRSFLNYKDQDYFYMTIAKGDLFLVLMYDPAGMFCDVCETKLLA